MSRPTAATGSPRGCCTGCSTAALDQVVLSLLQAKDAGEDELRGLERLIAAARKKKASRGDGKVEGR